MSELSTVAIKDGHRGHPHHHLPRQVTSNPDNPDAQRADRISRLAGLERVNTVRQAPQQALTPQAQSYFDSPTPANVAAAKERSTVGSASATGSVGGRTTWASGSNAEDAADKMSEDMDTASSAGGFSDEGNASLVGFGEGAGSTVSGPVSTSGSRNRLSRGTSGLGSTPTRADIRMAGTGDVDAMDQDSGAEAAEHIMRSRSFTAGQEPGMTQQDGQKQLGKFNFE